MAHQVRLRRDEAFQRRIDGEEINVGNKSIDTGVDAGRRRTVHIAVRRHEPRQHGKIGDTSRIRRLRRVAADTLEMIALRVVIARLLQPGRGQSWMLLNKRIPERGK